MGLKSSCLASEPVTYLLISLRSMEVHETSFAHNILVSNLLRKMIWYGEINDAKGSYKCYGTFEGKGRSDSG